MCTAVRGHKIYVAGHNTANGHALEHVYEYNISTDRWEQLPSPGQYYGVPHIIGGKLCIIGGRLCETQARTNKISTFNEAKDLWTSHYPDLLSERTAPGVITHLEHVIVAGGGIDIGDGRIKSAADDIEILNWTDNLQWRKVSVHLPKPMVNLKMTICDECMFIVGYCDSTKVWGKEKYKIAINAITKGEDVTWDQITAENLCHTTPVPNSASLLTIGGFDSQGTTADIKMYDVTSKQWKNTKSSLTFARSSPGVAMVSANAIVVIGGYTDAENIGSSCTNIVEMGQFECI